MNVRTKLKGVHAKLIEAVRGIKGRNEWHLFLYKGFIKPDMIDITKDNILSQAITNTPKNIKLVAEIELKKKNNFFPTENIDSVTESEIKALINSIRDYINYLTKIRKEIPNG